jgi:hypothetical protein
VGKEAQNPSVTIRIAENGAAGQGNISKPADPDGFFAVGRRRAG